MILKTLRKIHTYLKSIKPEISHYTEYFKQIKKHELLYPSRFDTIEKQVKTMNHKNLYNSKYTDLMNEYNATLVSKPETVKEEPYDINKYSLKHKLMRGNGNLIGSNQHTE